MEEILIPDDIESRKKLLEEQRKRIKALLPRGSIEKIAIETGYSKGYITGVLNGSRPMNAWVLEKAAPLAALQNNIIENVLNTSLEYRKKKKRAKAKTDDKA
jgi:hypothetical protein